MGLRRPLALGLAIPAERGPRTATTVAPEVVELAVVVEPVEPADRWRAELVFPPLSPEFRLPTAREDPGSKVGLVAPPMRGPTMQTRTGFCRELGVVTEVRVSVLAHRE